MRRSFIVSLTLHLAALMALLLPHLSQPPPEQAPHDSTVSHISGDIIPKPTLEVGLVEVPTKDGIKSVLHAKNLNRSCNNFYGGIGVSTSMERDAQVTKVYDGYPASRAGIKAGMYIYPINDTQVPGEPGSLLKLKVWDGDRYHEISIVRDKICIKDRP